MKGKECMMVQRVEEPRKKTQTKYNFLIYGSKWEGGFIPYQPLRGGGVTLEVRKHRKQTEEGKHQGESSVPLRKEE